MRVLQITTLYPRPDLPQFGIFIKEQTDALIATGCDLHIISVLTKENFRKIENHNEKSVTYIEFSNPLPGGYNLWVSGIALARKIEKLFGKKLQSYEIFHGHETMPSGVAAVILASKYKKRSVVTVHGLDVNFGFENRIAPLRIPNKKMCKFVYRKADTVVGVSNRVCETVKCSENKAITACVYNGYNPDKFVPSPKIQSEKFQIVCVGNYIGWKRIDDLIKAIGELENKDLISCKVFGKGKLEQYLKELVLSLGLDDCISFQGYQDVPVIAEAMRNADLFVLPSESEAFGCVFLEAMGCGTPIIACENQGISELITHGKDGLLVPARSPQKISYWISQLINDKALLTRLGEEALNTAKKYTWEESAKRLMDVYKALISD